MTPRPLLLSLIAAVLPVAAQAAEDKTAEDKTPEVVVTADPAGLLERRPSSLVFGVDKPLLETPRSASFVSDTTLERYGVRDIDQLVEISPSTYTASFYGVPGSLNIRGTLAEDYFEGFKRIENRGTYATPIGDAADLQILRGPPNPVFGPGKVGGLLNFIPKTARDADGALSDPEGDVDLGVGSYAYKDATLEGGAPVKALGLRGGIYGYLDLEDAHSFYRGVYPRRQTGEVSGEFDLGSGYSLRLDGMIYHSDGDVQTPGWNRLTQTLIDTGAYQGGRNTALPTTNGLVTAAGLGFYPYGGLFSELLCYAPGCTNPVHQLTANVAPEQISTRDVLVGPNAFSNTTTYTAYARLEHPLAGGTARFETFYDDLNNARFVSYGFPASYQTYALEERASWIRAFAPSPVLAAKSDVGLDYRYVDAHLRESFNSGIIDLDRTDLGLGPEAGDVIASPFETVGGQPGWPWDLDVHSNIREAGLFGTLDLTLLNSLDLIVGGREDAYNVSSGDRGALSYEAGGVNFAHADRSRGSWTASVSYHAPFGLVPYYVFDRAEALEIDQASDLLPGEIGAGGRGGWLSASYLSEAGVKADGLGHRLAASFAVYRQTRSDLVIGPGASSIEGTLSKGVELELRYAATRHLSFTYAGNLQRTEVKGPDGTTVYVEPGVFGVPGVLGYGGAYLTTVAALPGRAGDYELSTIPHSVNSLFATWTGNAAGSRYGATLGGTYVSKTATIIQGGVVYPSYWLANASAFVDRAGVRISLNADNLFNARYFTPDADPTYTNVAALPGVGRSLRLRVKKNF